MLNAKYNKHKEWIGFLNTKMLFWKQIPLLFLKIDSWWTKQKSEAC